MCYFLFSSIFQVIAILFYTVLQAQNTSLAATKAVGSAIGISPAILLFFILLPAVFLCAINFITYNTAPIADWGPYF